MNSRPGPVGIGGRGANQASGRGLRSGVGTASAVGTVGVAIGMGLDVDGGCVGEVTADLAGEQPARAAVINMARIRVRELRGMVSPAFDSTRGGAVSPRPLCRAERVAPSALAPTTSTTMVRDLLWRLPPRHAHLPRRSPRRTRKRGHRCLPVASRPSGFHAPDISQGRDTGVAIGEQRVQFSFSFWRHSAVDIVPTLMLGWDTGTQVIPMPRGALLLTGG
jgi:hypothetical protein